MRSSLAAVLALALATGGTAAAQPDDGPARRKRAGEHVRRGDDYKAKGEYERAIVEYLAAYELVPHPELFFNLGQVYRLSGQPQRAIEYYERYLAVEPDGRAADQARAFVEQLEASRTPHPAPTPGRGTPTRPGPVIVDAPPRPDGTALRWAGATVGGLGIVAIGLGVKFGLDARSISDDLSEHDAAWTDELLDRQADGERAEQRMWIATGVGTGLVVTGAVLFWIGHRQGADEASPGLIAAPWLGADGGGLVVGRGF
jgi:tetratricopeptide (TPR) repeat protein